MNENAKVGIIGRNGTGKTTLFRLITGEDTDFLGQIEQRKGVRILLSKQEHFDVEHLTPLEYVMSSLPRFEELKGIMDAYESGADTSEEALHAYSDAEHEFSRRSYYGIDERILSGLEQYGIDVDRSMSPLKHLSGGQKRFMELVRLSFSEADLILLDEPTNHMDYVGKAHFIKWLKNTKDAVCVISHDRDVLEVVDDMIELKDQQLHKFKGNYAAYLKQNGLQTITNVMSYEESLKRLDKLHVQWMEARRRKLMAKSDSGRNNAKTQELRFEREYTELKESMNKPSFWIDKETLAETNEKLTKGYHKYKTKNIRVGTKGLDEHEHTLMTVTDMSLGYGEHRLFSSISFSLDHGDRIQVKGRNGAGKTTLIRSILANYYDHPTPVTTFHGSMKFSKQLRIGVYEQEVDPKYLTWELGVAVSELYYERGQTLTDQGLKQVLSSYLFDPIGDAKLRIDQLSGGQRARFQLIRMLCAQPNLLILDEPTNHLDLPSIEELEKALTNYQGAILYISHDSYFVRGLGGETIVI